MAFSFYFAAASDRTRCAACGGPKAIAPPVYDIFYHLISSYKGTTSLSELNSLRVFSTELQQSTAIACIDTQHVSSLSLGGIATTWAFLLKSCSSLESSENVDSVAVFSPPFRRQKETKGLVHPLKSPIATRSNPTNTYLFSLSFTYSSFYHVQFHSLRQPLAFCKSPLNLYGL